MIYSLTNKKTQGISVEKHKKEAYKPDPWLRWLARSSAWILAINLLVLVVSGWGITKSGVIYDLSLGLIDRRLANTIHTHAGLPLAVFFLLHATVSLKISLTRSHPDRAHLINGILIVISLGLLSVAVYMQSFSQGG
ncbi:MAG: hypothetical protein JXA46_02345 [Dehalococcoidales bacterium]|nr:hypothetical protein [Dehalococcoidales bacterium]